MQEKKEHVSQDSCDLWDFARMTQSTVIWSDINSTHAGEPFPELFKKPELTSKHFGV